MTSRELLYVKTIAEEKSLTRAAQKLYITQPSLSHCIRNLEDELGAKLFKRTTDGLLLTYAGERYYQTACHILRVYDDYQIEVNDINHLDKGRITFGITNYLATWLLPQILPEFHREHPRIELVILEENSTEMEHSLMAGKLDFVIMHSNPDARLEEKKYLRFHTLSKDPFVVAAPPDNPYCQRAVCVESMPYPMLDLSLLADEPFLMVSRGQRIRQMSDHILQCAGIVPHILFVSKSYETLRRLTAQGMGYTLVPQQYAEIFQSSPAPCYFSIDPTYEPYWNLIIAVSDNNYLSAASRAFIEKLNLLYGSEKRAFEG